ncbi:MAG: hypothetical protein EAZ89_02375 [Bacteroidetes bacterium]|nr:MAG: hypothetical protein EAZ89_02375 [Bacteroidota bacterium]
MSRQMLPIFPYLCILKRYAMRFFPALALLLCLNTACAQPPARFDTLPSDHLLVKDASVRKYYHIAPEAVYLYADSVAKSQGRPEAAIYADEAERFAALFRRLPLDSVVKIYQAKGVKRWPSDTFLIPAAPPKALPDSLRPLAGLRIALDPGHVAGDFEGAKTEGKYVEMKASARSGNQPIQFWEANLTLATAFLIRERLEALGATVYMTRTQPGIGALGLSYAEWKKTLLDSALREDLRLKKITEAQIRSWSTHPEADKIYYARLYNPRDLRARANLINAFQPDLTLIIHYNVDEPNWRKAVNGIMSPSESNYCMAFVPGSLTKGELIEPEARVTLLRMLLSEDVPQSLALSEAFISASVEKTGVPVVSEPNNLPYLSQSCLYAGTPGVYARNLSLNRLVAGPLCYGESLCQDHRAESLALNRQEMTVAGMAAPARIEVVAEAYVEAVLRFVAGK